MNSGYLSAPIIIGLVVGVSLAARGIVLSLIRRRSAQRSQEEFGAQAAQPPGPAGSGWRPSFASPPSPQFGARQVTVPPAGIDPNEVLFVVRGRRWQVILLRTIGIVCIVAGTLMAVLSVVSTATAAVLGPIIAGFGLFGLGLGLVVMARGLARARLEVTPSGFRWSRGFGEVQTFMLADIVYLAPMTGQYGGLVGKGFEHRTLFRATTIDLEYNQLFGYLRTYRPDLVMPFGSAPTV